MRWSWPASSFGSPRNWPSCFGTKGFGEEMRAMGQQTTSWLFELRRLYFRYLAIGLCFAVPGSLTAVLTLHRMANSWPLGVSLAVGFTLSGYVWSRTGNASCVLKSKVTMGANGLGQQFAQIANAGTLIDRPFRVPGLHGNDSTAGQYGVAFLSPSSTAMVRNAVTCDVGLTEATGLPGLLHPQTRGVASARPELGVLPRN
jgi:hypothetical protein